MKKFFLVLIFIFCTSLFAKEVKYLMRSPRGLLMGDAYTTLANDEYSLFYNPALLARNKGFAMFPIPVNISATDPTEDMDRFDTGVANTTSELYNQISGLPLYLNASYAPTIKMGGFGLSLFSATETNITLLNNTHPMIDLYYKNDNGFVVGYGGKFGDLNVGMSVKYISRKGAQGVKSLYDPDLVGGIGDVQSAGDFAALFGGDQGTGLGFDLGIDYFKKTGASEFAVGFSILDVNGTKLNNGANEANVPEQPMIMSAGISFRQDFKIFDYALSADLHPLNARIDNNRRIHLGAEIGTPIVRLLGGYNAGYFSYGTQIDIGFIDLYLGFYDVEIGTGYKKQKANRFLLYVSLFDMDFDF